MNCESCLDQTGNLALSKNVENGRPVRVIRGYKSKSPFAPEEGYRYDGKEPDEESQLKCAKMPSEKLNCQSRDSSRGIWVDL